MAFVDVLCFLHLATLIVVSKSSIFLCLGLLLSYQAEDCVDNYEVCSTILSPLVKLKIESKNEPGHTCKVN